MTTVEPKLTLLGHIYELRKRLIRSVLAVIIGIIISFIFYQWIFHILELPAQGFDFIFIKPTEMIGIIMKVCLAVGLIIAMPYLTLQAVLFIRPALTKKEEKYVYIVLPWVALMFFGGVVFGYFILIPPAIKFLLTFGSDIAVPQITIDSYISLVTRLLLAIGLVFEMPVFTTFLARIGIIKPEWLASKRKAAIIGAFILAAIITPTFDPINQSLVAIPLVILYEMSIWLAKLVYRQKKQEDASSPES
jgi:sec-independent protein translocase protein TatC